MLFCPRCGEEVIECVAKCQAEINNEKSLMWEEEVGYCENCGHFFYYDKESLISDGGMNNEDRG